jgi:MoaA/NifB/PqqE/SkfB family radical SAM enzyme
MSFWCRNSVIAGRYLPPPRYLLVEITSYCNLKCIMCPKTHDSVNTEESKVMSWEVFEKITPLFPRLEAIDLTGLWGEAFLHPDLYLKMLKRARQDDVMVHTTSNATLLTDDLARQLVETWLDRLIVSVDAATPETYASIRPPGDYSKVLAGLESIHKWKQKLNSPHPRVDLAFVGMRRNIKEFPDVVRMAGKLGVEQISLQAMGAFPGMEDESIAGKDKALGRKMYEEGKRIGDELGVRVVLFPEDQFEEDRDHHNIVTDFKKYRKACRDPWIKAVVTATGEVLACCATTHPLGNLNESSFDEIWYGKAFNDLRKAMLSENPPEMCRSCTGIAWQENDPARDAAYFRSLILPHIDQRLRDHFRRYGLLRWAKRLYDRRKKPDTMDPAG